MIEQDLIEQIERSAWATECELASLRRMIAQLRAEQDATAFYLTVATFKSQEEVA